MTKYSYLLGILIVLLLMNACKSTQSQFLRKLPDFQECKEEPKVFDTGIELNKLSDLKDISYASTYNMIFSKSDSLEKEAIRKFNTKQAKSVVKHILPKTHFLSDSTLRNKNYNDIMFNTSDVKWYSRNKASIANLLVNTTKEKQLFIEVRTYTSDSKFRNNINVLIFNTKLKTLLYYDKVHYRCDIRDKDAFIKVLGYALNKLKQFETN